MYESGPKHGKEDSEGRTSTSLQTCGIYGGCLKGLFSIIVYFHTPRLESGVSKERKGWTFQTTGEFTDRVMIILPW